MDTIAANIGSNSKGCSAIDPTADYETPLPDKRVQAPFKGRDPPIRFLLTNADAVKPLFKFIHNMKRLQETFKELTRIRPKFGKDGGEAGTGG